MSHINTELVERDELYQECIDELPEDIKNMVDIEDRIFQIAQERADEYIGHSRESAEGFDVHEQRIAFKNGYMCAVYDILNSDFELLR